MRINIAFDHKEKVYSQEKYERNMNIRTIVLLGLILLLISGCQFYEEPVACTMDAKICPDGSAVGRMPPDCEFAPCPGESTTQSTINDEQ